MTLGTQRPHEVLMRRGQTRADPTLLAVRMEEGPLEAGKGGRRGSWGPELSKTICERL